MNSSHLLEILRKLNFSDLEAQALAVSKSVSDDRADLVLALVGEFNAGKTSIINTLLESAELETKPIPTTSTIYTVRFGAEHPKAVIHFRDGSTEEVEDFTVLDNKKLEEEAVVIDVQDTSRAIPERVVLVDTPGLSSGNINHTSVLTEFLPNADALLLVVDIQTEPTRALIEYVKTAALAGCPMYLVLTKSDTKSAGDIQHIKDTLRKDPGLPVKGVITVSAKEGDMESFYALINELSDTKLEILKGRAEYRLRALAEEALKRVEALLSASQSVEKLDTSVEDKEKDYRRLQSRITELAWEIDHETESMRRTVASAFEQEIYERLEYIVTSSLKDYDAEAVTTINSTSSLMVNQYKNAVLQLFAQKTLNNKRQGDTLAESLSDIDLSGLGISALSYDISLNAAGHQYDGYIANGVKLAGVAAAIYFTAGAASGAAAGTGTKVMTAVNVADTASDIGSIISNHRLMRRMKSLNSTLKPVNQIDELAGKSLGNKKGLVETMVGFVTERSQGKPQRRRAIYQYITNTLAPAFNLELLNITRQINALVLSALEAAAEEQFKEISAKLTELKADRDADAVAYRQKINDLRTAREQLSILVR